MVKHYIDRAISAKTDNRPQFQQMIKDSERKLFDMVLVWKLDRFARNRYDSARYKTQLKKNGVKLMSATEVISDGPEGIILESVLEGYAEYYSADLSEKVVRGMTENALKGKYNGGAVPIGYVIDAEQRFQPDSLTAPFVAEAFKRYNEGATMTEIRDWLNERHIKNPRGGPMTYNTVQHMLNNRRYIGELKYRDILITDAIPPIVSAELFQEVQEKMAKNKKAPARRRAEDDYLLTTKLFCGHCGALMFGESGTSRTGDVHRYYKCAAAKKRKTCTKKTVRKQWLEDLVVNETMKLIRDNTVIDSLVAAVMELQNKESTSLPLYEKQLRETETGIQNMLNAIQAGILTSSTKERLEALEAQKKDLETKIAEEKLAKPVMKEEFVRFWLLHFRKLDLSQKEQRQALIDTFINAIYLYDDKVLITFNYKEGTETISFGEATEAATKEKSSDIDCLGAPQAQVWTFLLWERGPDFFCFCFILPKPPVSQDGTGGFAVRARRFPAGSGCSRRGGGRPGRRRKTSASSRCRRRWPPAPGWCGAEPPVFGSASLCAGGWWPAPAGTGPDRLSSPGCSCRIFSGRPGPGSISDPARQRRGGCCNQSIAGTGRPSGIPEPDEPAAPGRLAAPAAGNGGLRGLRYLPAGLPLRLHPGGKRQGGAHAGPLPDLPGLHPCLPPPGLHPCLPPPGHPADRRGSEWPCDAKHPRRALRGHFHCFAVQ